MKNSLILFVTMFTILNCASTKPQMTQLQIREFQTKSFETNDLKMVLKAMINVLQDDNYIVKNADLELGLLTAAKEIDVETGASAFWGAVFDTEWSKNQTIEVSANITVIGEQCRVRVNFQSKTFDNKGAVKDLKQIDDLEFYQNFFAKVDKGIFIQKEGI